MRYPGGKQKLSKKIYKRRPAFQEFRECFMGGGSMLHHVRLDKKLWFNDKNPLVYDHWWQLKSNPDYIPQLLDLLRLANKSKNKHRMKLFTKQRDQLFLLREKLRELGWEKDRMSTLDEYREAKAATGFSPASWYLVTNWAMRNVCTLRRTSIASPCKLFIKKSQLSVNKKALLLYRKVLQASKLTCLDYVDVLEAPGEGVWIFLDPPYLCETGNMYDGEEWQQPCHELLAQRLCESPHKWFLTIGHSDYFRSLYDGYLTEIIEYTASLPHRRRAKNPTQGKEMWVRNYPNYFESFVQSGLPSLQPAVE